MAAEHRSTPREYLEALLIAALFLLFTNTFVIKTFFIPSGSMEDTLLVGDFLLANKFLYGAQVPFTSLRLPAIRDPRRGDIIVFRAPHQDKDFIKRCVAVGGDTVELRDNKLLVNGEGVEEAYVVLKGRTPAVANFGPLTVPQGYLFMLGDNRNNSQDSRFWGPLDEKLIKGKAMVLYLSWDKDRSRPRFSRIGDIIR